MASYNIDVSATYQLIFNLTIANELYHGVIS